LIYAICNKAKVIVKVFFNYSLVFYFVVLKGSQGQSSNSSTSNEPNLARYQMAAQAGYAPERPGNVSSFQISNFK